jgi:hypothetical protein
MIEKKINITDIPSRYLSSSESIINYMLDHNYKLLVNNLGAGIEYQISDIEDSFEHLIKFVKS